MTYVYLVRRHPPISYWGKAHQQSFTIYGVFHSIAEAKAVATKANKRSRYLHTVKRLKVSE